MENEMPPDLGTEQNKPEPVSGMIVRCLYDRLVLLSELRPHPKNRNKHPEDQIKMLAKILQYQGWRYPIKVSKLSGYITTGHGRLEAARLNGWSEVPVNFQDYDNPDQEYADVQSDNAIASWAELDLAGINNDVPDLGPDFDIDMLGVKNFLIDPADFAINEETAKDALEKSMITCPSCNFRFSK
jgi:hypothetical protein